jgi:hypothetical protein
MCLESYGAVLHVEFLNMITYEGPIRGSKCLFNATGVVIVNRSIQEHV